MDVSLESKSLPSVGYSRKSYLQVTSQRLARGKLVHLHGRRSLALPSVGPDTQEGLRNHFAAKGYSRRAAKLASTLKVLSFQLVAYIRQLQEGIHNTVQKGCEITSQQKGDFATLCKMLPSAWSDWIAMAVTSSFQLQIAYRLKNWILEFLIFEMIFSQQRALCVQEGARKYVIFMILYVDDIQLIGNDVGPLSLVKIWLFTQFQMKDLGEMQYVLGIKVFRDCNPLEVIVLHLLIRGMTSLSYRDGLPMVSALVCMVTLWTRPMWDIESTLELDFEGLSISMGPSGPHSELIYLVGMSYEGWIGFRFTFVQKGVLVIIEIESHGLQPLFISAGSVPRSMFKSSGGRLQDCETSAISIFIFTMWI
uniref:Reverse transcriptase Ty1/copia-type domain-containing protein n=1 Tax=Vitis vinifera TaxID=29760 RepID=A5B0W0_VITVI|nr:hypothetical protein VITISV_032228 [Vitis vinifera]